VTPRWLGLWLLLLPGVAGAQTLCGDLNLDGRVDAADAALLRGELARQRTLSLEQSLSCDVIHETRAPGLEPDPNDVAGTCSLADADVMTRAGLSLSPGPAQACALGAATYCCAANAGVGCEVPETVECVCATNPSCCTQSWSAACASVACSPPCAPSCQAGEAYCAGGCTSLQSDRQNCGACGRACTNAHGSNACTAGACSPSCSFGWQSCDMNLDNGCESLRATAPSCTAASSLGSLAGDAAGSMTRSGFGEAWFSVQLAETVGGFPHDLSAQIELDSPASVNFDLTVLCLSCGGSSIVSSQPAGTPDVLYVHQTDGLLSNDSVALLIHVQYVSNSLLTACGSWTLTLTGDTGVPGNASVISCGP
jgi:hypothetical protein